jgi:hypothetical protein
VDDPRISKWTEWVKGPLANSITTMHLHRWAHEEVAKRLPRWSWKFVTAVPV